MWGHHLEDGERQWRMAGSVPRASVGMLLQFMAVRRRGSEWIHSDLLGHAWELEVVICVSGGRGAQGTCQLVVNSIGRGHAAERQ